LMLKLNQYGKRIQAIENSKKLSKQKIIETLIKLNKKNPFKIKKGTDIDLEIEWKIIGAKWKEVLGEAWKNKTYTAYLSFYPEDNLVKYSEKIVETKAVKAGPKFEAESFKFKGAEIFRRERGYQYAIKKDYSIGEVYDYKFEPADVRNVIAQVATENGWDFMLCIKKPKK